MATSAAPPRISNSQSASMTLSQAARFTKSASFREGESLRQAQAPARVTASSSPIDLEKILKLLTHKHSEDLLERHQHALLKVAKRNRDGYVIEDTPLLALIIHHLNDRVLSEQQGYIKGLAAIIAPLGKSLHVGNAEYLAAGRSVTTLQSGVIALMDALAELLNSPVMAIAARAASICESITAQLSSQQLVSADTQGDTVAMTASLRTSTDGRQLLKAAVGQAAGEQTPQARISAMVARALVASSFATRLATAWQLACDSSNIDDQTNDDSAMRVQMMTALAVVTTSTTALQAVAQAEIFMPLLGQLAQNTFELTGYEGNMAVDLLFLLVTHEAVDGEVQRQACCKAAVVNLSVVLRRLLVSTAVVAKQLRNDILMLGTLLANDDQIRALMVEHHFFELVLRALVAGDIATRHPDVVRAQWSNTIEDFDFFKTAATFVTKFAKNYAAQAVVAHSPVMDLLKLYLQHDAFKPPRNWRMQQHDELQLLCLSMLNAMLPASLEAYHASRMNSQLLALLNWAIRPSDDEPGTLTGAVNSFHATGDFSHSRALALDSEVARNNGHRSQARLVLRCLLTLVELRQPRAADLHQDLLDQDLLTELVDFLDDPLPVKADRLCVELRTLALELCSAMCHGRVHVQELFSTAGVDMLVPYLQASTAALQAGLGHQALLISAIDATWSCIVGCRITEAHFFGCEGVFVLLDLLERCPVELRNLVLGCLADIAETATGLQHLLQWQGQGNPRPNIAALLCSLWRDTCVDLQCPALVKGGLVEAALDPQSDGTAAPFPLHSRAQAGAQVVPAPGTTPGLAVIEVLRNERAKIYGLCGLIGFDKCHDMLGNNDRIVLVLIEQYLDLKAGEVWAELVEELDAEGVVPVDFDDELIIMTARINEAMVTAVVEDQRALLDAQNIAARTDEELEFIKIKESLKARAQLQSLSQAGYNL